MSSSEQTDGERRNAYRWYHWLVLVLFVLFGLLSGLVTGGVGGAIGAGLGMAIAGAIVIAISRGVWGWLGG